MATASSTNPVPDTTELARETTALVTEGRDLRISSRTEYDAAGQYLKRVVGAIKRVAEIFREPKKTTDAAHKAVCRAEATLLAGPREVEQTVRGMMTAYLVEEDRQRRLEQARLQAAEREKAEEARRQEADALDAAGDTEGAVALLDQPLVAPVIELAPPKTAGVAARRKYRFEVYDPAAVKPAYTVPDEVKIRRTVDAHGMDAAALVGGIRVWEDRVLAVTAE